MRVKKIKGSKELIENSKYIAKENPFPKKEELHIEIGMGKGTFINEYAKQNKKINFIGIEKQESIMAKAILLTEKYGNQNLKLMYTDAHNLFEHFKNSVDVIYLNFSDPWPKKRHTKRRLTYKTMIDIYTEILKNNGKVVMKTDNVNLFEYSIESFSEKGYIIRNIRIDLHKEENNEIKTEYEEKFIKMNKPIYKFEAYRK